MVEKHLIEEDVVAGKKRGERKGLTKPIPRVSAIMLLENQIKTSLRKEKMVDKEFAEVERYFLRITDPEQHEKIKLEVEYLDEMIKQESLRIHKLNLNQTRFKRLDFVQNEVEKERKMV